MKTFIISSSDLTAKCDKLVRVLNTKNTLPVLDNFVFDVDGSELKITAADSENWAIGSVELVECSGAFSFGVNARTLVTALKEVPEQPLTFTIEGNNLNISYANGQFNMPTADVNDYPAVPKMVGSAESPVAEIELSVESIKRIFSRATPFVEIDDLRPIMGGICFDYGEQLEAAASNGHILIKLTEKCKATGKDRFVLSIKAAKLAESFIGKSETELTLKHNRTNSYIGFESFELYSRLIEGRYPNFNSVIPTDYTDFIDFDKREVVSAIKRALVLSNASTGLLKYDVKGMEMTISGEDIDFSTKAETNLMVNKSGRDLKIGLKGSLTQTALNVIPSDRVMMMYRDASRAIIFKNSSDNDEYEQVVIQMPMMLND